MHNNRIISDNFLCHRPLILSILHKLSHNLHFINFFPCNCKIPVVKYWYQQNKNSFSFRKLLRQKGCFIMKLKKILCLALAAMTALAMTSCGNNGGSSSDTSTDGSGSDSSSSDSATTDGKTSVDIVKEQGYIVMSTNAEFEPFEYMEGQEFKGIDIEISQKIADKLGVELKINNTSFDSLPMELQSGKCNFVAAGMSYTEDKAKNIDFSDPYFNASQSIIVMKDSDIKGPDDLNGKKIGVQLGTTGDTYCTENVEGAEVSRLNKGVDAVSDLIRGSLDAVVIDDFPAQKLVANNADKVVKLEDALTVEEYCLAVPKGDIKYIYMVMVVR